MNTCYLVVQMAVTVFYFLVVSVEVPILKEYHNELSESHY